VLLKGRLGSDGVAVLAAFKSWFAPSIALAVTCEYNFRARASRYGLCAQVGVCVCVFACVGRGWGSGGLPLVLLGALRFVGLS